MPFRLSFSRFFLVLGVALAMLVLPWEAGFGQDNIETLRTQQTLRDQLAKAKETLVRVYCLI